MWLEKPQGREAPRTPVRFPLCAACILLVALAGCSDRSEVSKETVIQEGFTFCHYTRSSGGMEGSGPDYFVRGCPKVLLKAGGASVAEATVPENATGLQFFFQTALSEPPATVRINVHNGSKLLLDDQITFVGGQALGRDAGEDIHTENGTATAELVFATCDATRVAVRWESEPMVDAQAIVRGYLYITDPPRQGIDEALCSDYWGPG